jgi:hypothetical protein
MSHTCILLLIVAVCSCIPFSCIMAMRVGIAAAVAALCCLVLLPVASAQGPVQSTLQDPKNVGACIARFNVTLTVYYANDTGCAQMLTQAFNATMPPGQCPNATIANVGTPVHQCMNKNNTNQVQGWVRLF